MNAPKLVAGGAGVLGPAAARETVDLEPDGSPRVLLVPDDSPFARVMTPSALLGLGLGGVAGAAYWLNKERTFGRLMDRSNAELTRTFAMTAIPTGVLSTLVPKEPEAGAAGGQALLQPSRTQMQRRQTAAQRPARTREMQSAGNSNGEDGLVLADSNERSLVL